MKYAIGFGVGLVVAATLGLIALILEDRAQYPRVSG